MKKKKPNPYLIDDENPEWTEEMFRTARPAREVFEQFWGKEATDAFFEENRKRIETRKAGRPKKPNPKKQITVRLDADILAALKKRGRGWQTLMNSALREWVGQHS